MTALPITCPICGKVFRPGRPMQHHLRDAHDMHGMKAHLIANPNDRQAAGTITGRRARNSSRMSPRAPRKVETFDLIEDWPA